LKRPELRSAKRQIKDSEYSFWVKFYNLFDFSAVALSYSTFDIRLNNETGLLQGMGTVFCLPRVLVFLSGTGITFSFFEGLQIFKDSQHIG
jgi:hypothetical protein